MVLADDRNVFSLRFYALASLAALALTACSQPQLTPQQAAGQNLYAARCAHCHEDNDLALKPPPPSVHNLFAHGKLPSGAPATDPQIIRTVIAGKGKMPSFAGRFNEDQMDALLAYLHTGVHGNKTKRPDSIQGIGPFPSRC